MKVDKNSFIVERNVEDMKKSEYSLDLESWKDSQKAASQPSREV